MPLALRLSWWMTWLHFISYLSVGSLTVKNIYMTPSSMHLPLHLSPIACFTWILVFAHCSSVMICGLTWVYATSITYFVCKCTTVTGVMCKWMKQSLHIRGIKRLFMQCMFVGICTSSTLFLFILLLCTLVTTYTVCYIAIYLWTLNDTKLSVPNIH